MNFFGYMRVAQSGLPMKRRWEQEAIMAEMQIQEYQALASAISPSSSRCPCCGSREFLTHWDRRICAYCRSGQ